MGYCLWHWGFGKYRADLETDEAYTGKLAEAEIYETYGDADDDRISEDETVLNRAHVFELE